MNTTRYSHRNRGSATLLVFAIAIAMSMALVGYVSFVNVTARAEVRSAHRVKAVYAAEFAIEQMYGALSDWLDANKPGVPTLAASTALANLSTAPTTTFTAAEGYSFSTHIIVPVENGVAVAAHTGISGSTNQYRFLAASEVSYRAPTSPAPVQVRLQREIVYTLTPIFQFAIFGDDVELFPGANFVVEGRVHSNARFFYGSNAQLTFQSTVTSVNGASNTHHPLDPRSGTHANNVTFSGGAPFIVTPESPPANVVATGPNAGGAREIIEIPDTSATDPNADERMFNKAGLKVLVNTTGSSRTSVNGVTVPANSRVFMTADGTLIPSSQTQLINLLDGAFSTSTIKDYREDQTVRLTDVDVGQLRARVADGRIPTIIPNATAWPSSAPSALVGVAIPEALRGKALWNSQLYVADISYGSTSRVGVRLRNGENLPEGGLTLSTENPAYIMGDYNTGGTPATNSGGVEPYVGTYYQPAAVIADAITVLSRQWVSGGYDTKGLSARDPVATTVNTAIIAGQVRTTSSAYSGGAENFLRLLEDWGGVRLSYYGSMIMLYQSQQATRAWGDTGNYYQAPNRNWHFDLNFINPNRLPKGTPVSRSLRPGQWMQLK